MPRKKSLFVSVFLMCAQLLLMGQEIAVQKVLCYKENGRVDLELAIFGGDCFCIKKDCCGDNGHSYKHSEAYDRDYTGSISGKHSHSPVINGNTCSSKQSCFDQPIASNWLERVPAQRNQYDPVAAIGWNVFSTLPAMLQNVAAKLSEAVPISKFLNFGPYHYQNDSVLMRC